MYPTGVGPLLEGWTKNFAGGATTTHPVTLVLVVAWLSGLIAAPFDPGPFGLVYAAYAIQFLVLLRRVGGYSPFTALLFPIPVAFFVAVFARSVVRTFVRREVRWRGRTMRSDVNRPVLVAVDVVAWGVIHAVDGLPRPPLAGAPVRA